MGGLFQPGETQNAGAIRHCRHLVNFCFAQNDRFYLIKTIVGFMDHEHVKRSVLIIDVIFNRFKWRARHHTPALAVVVTDSMNEALVALE